jgi:2-succinyl-6-hydroxy-2,4-cyclohexadiene-1-carboxylate synthase
LNIFLEDVAYSLTDRGEGRAALLLHGFTGSKESWQPLADRLAVFQRVIVVDLLGHGESSAPADPVRYQMAQCSADLAKVLDGLQLHEVDLLGYSMGGRLALHFALHHPERVRSLVLESASPGLESEADRQVRRHSDHALAERIERNGLEEFVNEWERLPLFASQKRLHVEDRRRLREQRLRNRPLGLANSLRGMGTGVQPALWGRLGELQCPVMLIVGELDEKFVAINRRMAAGIADARLEIVSRAGHSVHLEQTEAYYDLIQNFWR